MLGPVENTIYVNQQTATVASDKTAFDAKLGLQALANATALDGKDKEVQEVREMEENHGVDPDREHQRQEFDEELSEQDKKRKKKDEEKVYKSNHILDIKV